MLDSSTECFTRCYNWPLFYPVSEKPPTCSPMHVTSRCCLGLQYDLEVVNFDKEIINEIVQEQVDKLMLKQGLDVQVSELREKRRQGVALFPPLLCPPSRLGHIILLRVGKYATPSLYFTCKSHSELVYIPSCDFCRA